MSWLFENGEFIEPFTPEEQKQVDLILELAPYLRAIKLYSTEKNNPDFYAKLCKYFPDNNQEEEKWESEEEEMRKKEWKEDEEKELKKIRKNAIGDDEGYWWDNYYD